MTTEIPPTTKVSEQPQQPTNVQIQIAQFVTATRHWLQQRQKLHNKRVVASFFYGMLLSLDGSVRALRSNQTRKHLFNVGATLFALMVVLYLLSQVVFIPLLVLRRIVWASTYLATHDNSHNNSPVIVYFDLAVKSCRKVFVNLFLAMPEVGLYFVRYAYPAPMDRIFGESLRAFTAEIENPNFRLQTEKRTRKIESQFDPSKSENATQWWNNLLAFAHRYWSRLKVLTLVWIASFVPVIGFLAWPVATLVYLAEKVNYGAAVGVLLLTPVSPEAAKYVKGPLLRQVYELRALARELVEPYLSRSKMNKEQREVWLEKTDATIIGFTFPLFIMLWIPLLGPALYFALATSCSARLCLEIFDDVDLDDVIQDPVAVRDKFEPKLEFLYVDVSKQILALADRGDVLLEFTRNIVVNKLDEVLAHAGDEVLGKKKNE